jgi:hypothetical protein
MKATHGSTQQRSRSCAEVVNPGRSLGKALYMTATAQQIVFFDQDAYAATPPPPFALGRVLGVALILLVWAPIAWMVWTLT